MWTRKNGSMADGVKLIGLVILAAALGSAGTATATPRVVLGELFSASA